MAPPTPSPLRHAARMSVAFATAPAPWLVLGAVNLTMAVGIALRPQQSQDLTLVASWLRTWLFNGDSPYDAVRSVANYPPYGIVFLSPLALVPASLLKAVWALVNVVLALGVGTLSVKAVMGTEWRRHVAGVLGFFLAWEALRIHLGNGQFTLLAMTFGLLAVTSSRPAARGVFLGLAMIKPHVGLAFVAWAALRGDIASLAVAGATALVGTTVFAVRVHETLVVVALAYVGVLRRQFAGVSFEYGSLEIRPLIGELLGRSPMAAAVNMTIVVLLIGVVLLAVLNRESHVKGFVLLSVVIPWGLMSVFHNVYDLVLLCPVLAMLYMKGLGDSDVNTTLLLFATQTALVVDVPGLWWKLHGRGSMIPRAGIDWLAVDFDRLLICGLFVYGLSALIRRSGDPCAAGSIADRRAISISTIIRRRGPSSPARTDD